VSRDDITETDVIALMKDCAEASVALSEWFRSQLLSVPEAAIVMSITLTGMADTTRLTDKKIDRLLRHVRTLTRAIHAEGRRHKPSRRK
jgi:hypothetical protein